MRYNEARRLAEQFHNAFTPTVQTDNLEVIANLAAETNSAKVLAAVAGWHERRRNRRSMAIAAALRQVSGTKPNPVNDNRQQLRRRTA
jgi:ribosomal protein S17E